jgi:hypothetical protein
MSGMAASRASRSTAPKFSTPAMMRFRASSWRQWSDELGDRRVLENPCFVLRRRRQERADRDEGVHVIVLAGTGRAFCAGYNLMHYAQGSDVTCYSQEPRGA